MDFQTAVKTASHFISIDWGTTNLRLHLVKTQSGKISCSVQSNSGVKHCFDQWQSQSERSRIDYFQQDLLEQIQLLETQAGFPLSGLPLIISGMASSSIGLKELPYAQLPFSLTLPEFVLDPISSSPNFPYPSLLVSGLERAGDVMRGEECQLFGLALKNRNLPEKVTVILPGTHSKHLLVENGQLTQFKTYITGELFDLLSTHSLLRESVSKKNPSDAFEWNAYIDGLGDSKTDVLTQHLFSIRANSLQGHLPPNAASAYLSGLLIGSELKKMESNAIFFAGGETLTQLYKIAFKALHPWASISYLPEKELADLVVRAHQFILKSY